MSGTRQSRRRGYYLCLCSLACLFALSAHLHAQSLDHAADWATLAQDELQDGGNALLEPERERGDGFDLPDLTVRPLEADELGDYEQVPAPRPLVSPVERATEFPLPTHPPGVENFYLPHGPEKVLVPEYHAEEIEALYERVLELQPDGENRNLIERVREATIETEIGVDVSDEDWIELDVDDRSLIWGGRIHTDLVSWADDREFGGQSDYVEFRRLRLFAAGFGYGIFDYQLELEFAPEIDFDGNLVDNPLELAGSGVEVKDAYVGLLDLPWLGYLRIGHFRTPFSLEMQSSSNHITFLERGLPRIFTPGRELGLAAYNYSDNERWTWSYGAFIYGIPEDFQAIEDDNQGGRLIGRTTWTPYYDELSLGRYLVHTGVSYAYTRPRLEQNPNIPALFQRRVRFNARPEIHRTENLIDTGIIDAEAYHVLDAEFAWVYSSLSVQSELMWNSVHRAAGDTTELYGGYVYGSWFLTGEHRAYRRRTAEFGRVEPLENFWLVNTDAGRAAGWGAWELGFRYSFLTFPDFNNQRLDDLTLGVNWYWNPHTRMMFNWIHPIARNSPESVLPVAEGDILAMRLQVDF